MAFSSDIAKLIGDQLSRFVTLNRHQLAGQVANLDFWLSQVRNALEVLDGYKKRLERLRAGQEKYVAAHGTTEFNAAIPYYGTPLPPRRVPDRELQDAHKALCESAYRFLIRCCNEGLIQESELRTACEQLGISVGSSDLKQRP